MSGEPAWIESFIAVGSWLCAFLIVAAARYVLEQRFMALFRRRPLAWNSLTLRARVMPHTSPGQIALRGAALLTAMLGGAAIPLGPPMETDRWRLPWHILESADAGLLYVLAMAWASMSLLEFAQPSRQSEQPARYALGTLLIDALPLVLISGSLVLTAASLDPGCRGSLTLARWIELQAGWKGWRWIGFLQPILLLGWMIYAVPTSTDPQSHATLVRQIQWLNMALLTTAIFLGGWNGPLVSQFPALGILYTGLKVGVVSFVWVWIRASRPQPDLSVRAQLIWRWTAPLLAINLVATILLAYL